jgi:hypothetical protein
MTDVTPVPETIIVSETVEQISPETFAPVEVTIDVEVPNPDYVAPTEPTA